MFAIHISTKNRKGDLLFTLQKLSKLLSRPDVECVVFDDGSSDGTSAAVKSGFPQVRLLRNERSKGYLHCRNLMLNQAAANFVISLDDDAHFVTEDALERIKSHFNSNPACGVVAFRIFWGKELPEDIAATENVKQVKSFVGCGHAWRMKAWREIPDYPEWFEFYGEENFASLQLFRKGWRVDYVPDILIQHRVDLKARAKAAGDFAFRYRRSIRAAWYLYLMAFPAMSVPRNIGYTLWIQLRRHLPKGNLKIMPPLMLALSDLIVNLPKISRGRSPMTPAQYLDYNKLSEGEVYWNPQK